MADASQQLSEKADPKAILPRGGAPAPDRQFYINSLLSSNWPNKNLIRGFDITNPEFDMADTDFTTLLAKDNLFLRDFNHPDTLLELDPIVEQMESQYKWLTKASVPRTWRFLAVKGWLRDKLHAMKKQHAKDPTCFAGPEPETPSRRHTNYLPPTRSPRKRTSPRKKVLTPLLFCILFIKNTKGDQERCISVPLRDLQAEGADVLGADGNLNLQAITFEKLEQVIQDEFVKAWAGAEGVESFEYSKERYKLLYTIEQKEIHSTEHLHAAIHECHLPGSRFIEFTLHSNESTTLPES